MVAYLQDGVMDEERPKPTALPISHEAAFKWFYKDPQGEVQGEQSRAEERRGTLSQQSY